MPKIKITQNDNGQYRATIHIPMKHCEWDYSSGWETHPEDALEAVQKMAASDATLRNEIDQEFTCQRCEGSGWIESGMYGSMGCPKCDGTGAKK